MPWLLFQVMSNIPKMGQLPTPEKVWLEVSSICFSSSEALTSAIPPQPLDSCAPWLSGYAGAAKFQSTVWWDGFT